MMNPEPLHTTQESSGFTLIQRDSAQPSDEGHGASRAGRSKPGERTWLNAKAIPPLTERQVANIWARVTVIPETGCYEWTGTTVNGYGVYTISRVQYSLHRISYTITHGEIPRGLVVDHLCFNRACINPEHLRLLGHQENWQRRDPAKSRKSETHCFNGHEFTAETTYIVPKTGGRQCKTCVRDAGRRYKSKHKPARRAS